MSPFVPPNNTGDLRPPNNTGDLRLRELCVTASAKQPVLAKHPRASCQSGGRNKPEPPMLTKLSSILNAHTQSNRKRFVAIPLCRMVAVDMSTETSHQVCGGQIDGQVKLTRVLDGRGAVQFELGSQANGFLKFDPAIRPNGLPKLTYSLSFSL